MDGCATISATAFFSSMQFMSLSGSLREPNTSPPTIYCEAQSADSWEALASVLTPERVAVLHAAGYADPGRGPNYWKNYPIDTADDAALAREVLTILHDVYDYNGLPKLKVKTEDSAR
jgi:hypothetical protein